MPTSEEYYSNLFKKIKSEINDEKDEYIANVDTNELAGYLCTDKMLYPIEIDRNRKMTSDISKSYTIRDSKDQKKIQPPLIRNDVLEIETLRVDIPIIANRTNAVIRKIWPVIDDTIKLEENSICFKITTRKHSLEKSASEIEEETIQKKNQVFDWMRYIQ